MTQSDESRAGDTDLVLVGEISAPFGIRGQVKLRPLMDGPEALAKLPSVLLRLAPAKPGDPPREERRKVAKAQSAPGGAGGYTLTIEGVTDRDGAEALRGAQVFIRADELPPLEEGAYYERDLLGLQVETDAGRDLGRIEKVHYYPANDVYETDVALIPAVEAFVLEVDLAARRMLVRDVPGLRKDE